MNNQGTIKYKKEVKESDNKTGTKDNFEKYFPRPFWYAHKGRFHEMYYTNGDFINSSRELDGTMATICDENSSDENSSDDSKKCNSGDPTKTIKQEGEGEGLTGDGGEFSKASLRWHGVNGYNYPYQGFAEYHQPSIYKETGSLPGFEYMYGKDQFDLYSKLRGFLSGTGAVKDNKGFRRTENQQLRGTQTDGGE